LDANHDNAVSFFIRIVDFWDANCYRKYTRNNVETQEKLVIEKDPEDQYCLKISRYPIGSDDEWIEEMGKIPEILHTKLVVDL
jgi:hypothetical protein